MTTKEQYIRYCRQHKVPLFFEPFWLDSAGHDWDVLCGNSDGSRLYFVYHMEKKLGFRIIRNPFLTPYTGFLFDDNIKDPLLLQMLITQILNKLPSYHELNLDLLPVPGKEFQYLSLETKNKITNILSLEDKEGILSRYKPALKRQIKKAEKTLEIREMNDIGLFYQLHEKTFEKQDIKTVTPIKAFKKIWATCRTHQCGKLLFAIDADNNVHAAIFLTWHHHTAYYQAGGTDNAFYGSGAMSYLMHRAIMTAADFGMKYFDFEGSMLSGVNRFFRNFSPVEITHKNISKMDSKLLKMIKSVTK